ncbi:hypothetical protein CAEBREN_02837 [Caenorhabditis brenneri]|uniref:Uncharacterized protein n=1 Tax=Caenorhabditis brenneri TaxID=135651 RepID=G0MDU8_CAEBE|nr:hypothetical protein CAEBREN_02837 [Caenorhabditis brenneri]
MERPKRKRQMKGLDDYFDFENLKDNVRHENSEESKEDESRETERIVLGSIDTEEYSGSRDEDSEQVIYGTNITEQDYRLTAYVNFVVSEGISEKTVQRMDYLMAVIYGEYPPFTERFQLNDIRKYPGYRNLMETYDEFKGGNVNLICTISSDGARFRRISRREVTPMLLRVEGVDMEFRTGGGTMIVCALAYADGGMKSGLIDEFVESSLAPLIGEKLTVSINGSYFVFKVCVMAYLCDMKEQFAVSGLPNWHNINGCSRCITTGTKKSRGKVSYCDPRTAVLRTDDSIRVDTVCGSNGLSGDRELQKPSRWINAKLKRGFFEKMAHSLAEVRSYRYDQVMLISAKKLGKATGREIDKLSQHLCALVGTMNGCENPEMSIFYMGMYCCLTCLGSHSINSSQLETLLDKLYILLVELEKDSVTIKWHVFFKHLHQHEEQFGVLQTTEPFEREHKVFMTSVHHQSTNSEKLLINSTCSNFGASNIVQESLLLEQHRVLLASLGYGYQVKKRCFVESRMGAFTFSTPSYWKSENTCSSVITFTDPVYGGIKFGAIELILTTDQSTAFVVNEFKVESWPEALEVYRRLKIGETAKSVLEKYHFRHTYTNDSRYPQVPNYSIPQHTEQNKMNHSMIPESSSSLSHGVPQNNRDMDLNPVEASNLPPFSLYKSLEECVRGNEFDIYQSGCAVAHAYETGTVGIQDTILRFARKYARQVEIPKMPDFLDLYHDSIRMQHGYGLLSQLTLIGNVQRNTNQGSNDHEEFDKLTGSRLNVSSSFSYPHEAPFNGKQIDLKKLPPSNKKAHVKLKNYLIIVLRESCVIPTDIKDLDWKYPGDKASRHTNPHPFPTEFYENLKELFAQFFNIGDEELDTQWKDEYESMKLLEPFSTIVAKKNAFKQLATARNVYLVQTFPEEFRAAMSEIRHSSYDATTNTWSNRKRGFGRTSLQMLQPIPIRPAKPTTVNRSKKKKTEHHEEENDENCSN